MIYLLISPASPSQIAEMVRATGPEIKVAVDITLEMLACGGEQHFDCEQVLLDAGSRQDDVWGASWNSVSRSVTFWSVINLRPKRGLRNPEIQNPDVRARVERLVRRILEGP